MFEVIIFTLVLFLVAPFVAYARRPKPIKRDITPYTGPTFTSHGTEVKTHTPPARRFV